MREDSPDRENPLTETDLRAMGFQKGFCGGVVYFVKFGDSIAITDGTSYPLPLGGYGYVSRAPHSERIVAEAYRYEGDALVQVEEGELDWVGRHFGTQSRERVTGGTLHRRTKRGEGGSGEKRP